MTTSYYYTQAPSNLAEYQIFQQKYFSGCNITIFFGDVFVDEIVALQFDIQESLLPIFGYNSYTYDVVAHGARMINGVFKINFVESGYLFKIIKQLSDSTNELTSAGKFEALTTKEFLSKNYQNNFDDLDEYIKLYEDAIWGKAKSTNNTSNEAPMFPQDFNIMIVYSPGQGYDSQKIAADIRDQSTTIELLTGVHLSHCAKLIDSTGQPIQEEYQFIARDFNPVVV